MVYGGHLLRGRRKNDLPYQMVLTQVSTLFWRTYLQHCPDTAQLLRFSNAGQLLLGMGALERSFSP